MLVEQVPAILWTTDRELRIISVRGSGLQRLGLAASSVLGKRIDDFGEPLYHPRALRGENHRYDANWGGHDLEIRVGPLRDPAGTIVGTLGLAIDVSERKKAREELEAEIVIARQAQERYRLLFERNLAGVFRSTVDGRLLECNQAFARILGYDDCEAMLQVPTRELYFSQEDRDRYLGLLMAAREIVGCEARLRRRDGTEVWVLENGLLIEDPEHGQVIQGTIVDITGRIRVEALLRAERKILEEIARGLPLSFALDSLALFAEQQCPGTFCTIRLIDLHTGRHLLAAAPHMEGGLELENPGRLATGATELPMCASTPIFSSRREVLGTVALHVVNGQEPPRHAESIVLFASSIAAIAIERSQAESALRASEEKFRTLAETTSQAIWTSRGDGEVVDDSPSWRALTGQSREAILGSGWLDALHPDDRERIRFLVTESVRDGTPYTATCRVRNPAGEYRDIAIRSAPILDADQHVREWVSAASDITDRMSAERSRQQSDERFRLIVQATSDVVWDWDLTTNRLWWSEGIFTQFRHPVDGFSDISLWSDHLHPDDASRVLKGIHHLIDSGGTAWQDSYRFQRGDGTYIHVEDRGMVARDASGHPRRMLGAMVDITERRALESQLAQVQRVASLGTLAANMAHEFNNVLMGIQPFADLLRRANPDDERIQTSMSHITQSVSRGRKVTDEILRFTRGVKLTKETIDVRSWFDHFRPEAEALLGSGITLSMPAPSGDLRILGDVAQLNQVLANLILNARDASSAGDLVLVAAERCSSGSFGLETPGDWLHVLVRDQGAGMDPATLANIFNPLFTTKRGGTGLGLAICHQVITAHDGKISAESGIGKGSSFHILLPLAGADAGQLTKPGAVPSLLPRRVLIVEDETEVAEGLTQILSLENVGVRVVHRAAQTMEAVQAEDPDVILLDIGLPDVDGVTLFQQITSRWPDRRVVFMTGHYSRKELEHFLALPHVKFLQKPFTTQELLTTLASVFDKTPAR